MNFANRKWGFFSLVVGIWCASNALNPQANAERRLSEAVICGVCIVGAIQSLGTWRLKAACGVIGFTGVALWMLWRAYHESQVFRSIGYVLAATVLTLSAVREALPKHFKDDPCE